MAFRRKGRPTYSFVARTRTGRCQLSTGTLNRALAGRMETMWATLATDHRAWDLLDPVLTGDRSIG